MIEYGSPNVYCGSTSDRKTGKGSKIDRHYNGPGLQRDTLWLTALILGFWKDEGAATAIEYGLIAAGIAVAIIPVITGLGTKLKTTFSTIQTALK